MADLNFTCLCCCLTPFTLTLASYLDSSTWQWNSWTSSTSRSWSGSSNRFASNVNESNGRRWYVGCFTSFAGQSDQSNIAIVSRRITQRWSRPTKFSRANGNFAKLQGGIFVATGMGSAWKETTKGFRNCKLNIFFFRLTFYSIAGVVYDIGWYIYWIMSAFNIKVFVHEVDNITWKFNIFWIIPI